MRWQDTYKSNGTWILLAFMVAKIIAQYLLVHPSYDLHRDEYLHLDQANHLAWGFISLPPLTSWWAWVVKWLGGDSFWVRFFPALFGAFTVYFTWKIVEELGGGLFAKVTVSLAVFFSIILRLNILFQPNAFEILSWTAFFYFLIRYIKNRRSVNVYILAVILAMAFLNKYNVLFMIAGLAPALIISPHRKLLVSKHVLFALLLFLALILGNIIWQIENGVPFFRHMKQLAETQLVNMNRIDFVKEQILFFLNSFFVLVIAMIGFMRYPAFRPYRFIFLGFLISIIIYVYFKAKGYYAAGLYPVILAFGAVYLEQLTIRRKFLRVISIAVILILFLPVLRLGFPYTRGEDIAANPMLYRKMGLLRWEDGKEHHMPQDFADMLGWRELAFKVDSTVNTLREKDKVLILANNYGQAGAINFYTINDLQAVSFNADYLNWFPIGQPIQHVIRVMEIEEDDDDPERTQERSLCDTLILAGEITNEFAREKGTKIWLMKNVKGDVWPIILKEIEEHKK